MSSSPIDLPLLGRKGHAENGAPSWTCRHMGRGYLKERAQHVRRSGKKRDSPRCGSEKAQSRRCKRDPSKLFGAEQEEASVGAGGTAHRNGALPLLPAKNLALPGRAGGIRWRALAVPYAVLLLVRHVPFWPKLRGARLLPVAARAMRARPPPTSIQGVPVPWGVSQNDLEAVEDILSATSLGSRYA
ncbi:hypothetical protein MRX96_030545 [Rhipicephalus microplus]